MANEEIVKLDDVIKINQPLEIRLEYDEMPVVLKI